MRYEEHVGFFFENVDAIRAHVSPVLTAFPPVRLDNHFDISVPYVSIKYRS